MSTSSKGKTLTSSNSIKAYNKETLRKEIHRFTATNAQLTNDKLNIEAAKTKLKADKVKLINKKNIFIVKREELQTELTEAVTVFTINVQIPIIIVYDKLKAKRLPPFDGTKETLQGFFTETRYYYKFYNQNLSFDSNKIQNAITNIVGNALKWTELLLKNFFKNDLDNQ